MGEVVYIVLQFQPGQGYYDYPIAIYTSAESAKNLCARLNYKFASGVKLDQNDNFVKINSDAQDVHYYHYITMPINPDGLLWS